MGGQVYLQTDKFEVKLEGITFKPKDFEILRRLDFVFPSGKVWDRPPIVGIDIIQHPRDPSTLFLLLCFGVGCAILRLTAGKPLPTTIRKFLSDKRIRFVGFGIPEKKDLFPFKELGLKTRKVDIGYLAGDALKNPKCKKWELSELAKRVLGIKKMVGLMDASSNRKHAQIKSAMCRLFITSIIGMGLLNGEENASPKRSTFFRNMNSLHSFNVFKNKHGKAIEENQEGSVCVQIGENEDLSIDSIFEGRSEDSKATKPPLKGILKCPSTGLKSCKSVRLVGEDSLTAEALRRANSKGHSVSFDLS